MTVEKLIRKLIKSRDEAEAALRLLRGFMETPETARRMERRWTKAVARKPHYMKGRKYKKGTHWTQKEENKARVAANFKGTRVKKRVMSAAARKRISDAQKLRWAKQKAA